MAAFAAAQDASTASIFAMLASGPQSSPASYLRVASFGRAHRCIGLGDRELDALVLADPPAEHRASLGIIRRLGDEPFCIADAFGADQDPLGIHPGEDVPKALAFLTDQVFRRHLHHRKEHLGGGVIHHSADRADLEALAASLAHFDDERGHAIGTLFGLLLRRSARVWA